MKTSQQISEQTSPFSSYNQGGYQYRKFEQVTYTWTGQINRIVTIPTDPTFDLDLSNTARVFFIARVPLTITGAMATWSVSDSAAYVQIEKLINGVAPGSGLPIIPDPFDCTLAPYTTYQRNVQEFVLSIDDRSLDQGERLAILMPIPPDTLADLTIMIEYQYKTN